MKIAPFGLKYRSLAADLALPDTNPDKHRQVTPLLQSWFLEFADFCAFHKLALHCGLCRSDIANPKRAWQHWGECTGYKTPNGDTGGSLLIKTPTGSLWLGKAPQREELRPAQMEWLRQAEDVLPYFQFGLHCLRCEADIAGKNADQDAVYSAACRCTEFIGLNRDYREPEPLLVM